MYTFEIILLNIILLLFPVLLYLFYSAFSNKCLKKENMLFLDLALISSVFLVLRLSLVTNLCEMAIVVNIPLIIAYLQKRKISILIISLLIIFQGLYDYNLLLILFLEYSLIYLFYNYKNKQFINAFIIIKSLFILSYLLSIKSPPLTIIKLLIGLIILYFLVLLVVYLFEKSKQIIELHLTVKQFEQEKQVKQGLFKITHEIKNPIAVCKSYLDMYDSKNKDHQRFIPIIQEEMDKILYLLQDFLEMSKIQINADIMDINLLLENVINHFEPILKAKSIYFNYEIRQDEIYIIGDYNRLNQVLTNIIKNSLEAIDRKDGVIKIYTTLDSKNINIHFEDNGIGISEEDLEKIKEPFYTTKKNGTGLGVSLSCEIIKAHKGTIHYSSTLGKGTTVIVKLPLNLLP